MAQPESLPNTESLASQPSFQALLDKTSRPTPVCGYGRCSGYQGVLQTLGTCDRTWIEAGSAEGKGVVIDVQGETRLPTSCPPRAPIQDRPSVQVAWQCPAALEERLETFK